VLVQVPVLASVTVCSGDWPLPLPSVMLPDCTASVSKIIVCTDPVTPEGAVGSGDGAPAGATWLVVTFTLVPAAIVVPDWNVMVASHDPSGGYVAGVPSVAFDRVPELDAVAVLHGNVAAALELGDGFVVGLEPGAVVLGVEPDEELPPHAAIAAAAKMPNTSAARRRVERKLSITPRAYEKRPGVRILQIG